MSPIQHEFIKDQREAHQAQIEKELCEILTAHGWTVQMEPVDWGEYERQSRKRWIRLWISAAILVAAVTASFVILYVYLKR